MSKSNSNKSNRITNNKLSKNIIYKLMQPTINVYNHNVVTEIPNVTKIELNLLLYMSRIQDVFGNVSGLYYKDACAYLDCCKQSFYNALYGLEEKGYIQINFCYKEQSYWNILILDNMFLNEADDKKGYLNTNKKFLCSEYFKNLKLNEEKLLIYIAFIYHAEKGLTVYPKRICEWLGIQSVSLAWSYIDGIAAILPHKIIPGKHGDKILFEANNTAITEPNIESERENYLTHKLQYLLRKGHITYTSKDIKDLIILLGQKAALGIGKVQSVIHYVLEQYNSIQAALINKLLTPDKFTGELPALYI